MARKNILSRLSWDGTAVVLAVLACLAFWQATYPVKATWPGLPPAHGKAAALSYGFGDNELSYRMIGLMLQNAGDSGGATTNLKVYDYKKIRDWLWVSYALDPKANYIPGLAAFYFGAVGDKERLAYIVDYLAHIGKDNGAQRWRWLAQAVYLARFEMKDQTRALALANELAALTDPDMPIWTKQMPAFVLTKTGKKKAARDLLLTIMATDKTMGPADCNQTCWYIDTHLRESDDSLAKNNVYTAFCRHST